MKPSLKRYLYFVVFMSGLVTLAAELSASRLLGPVFGTSNVIWASIIGLILLYLTLGSWLGGRLADARPYPQVFFTVLLWGAFTIGLVPLASRPVLQAAARAVLDVNGFVVVGSFGVTLVLFIVPITLLGMTSPFTIRLLLEDAQNAGHISGRVSAISTVGGLLGSFLPVLLLIPLLGTTLTFMTLALALVIVGLIGFFMADSKKALVYTWMPVVLIVLMIVTPRHNLRPIPDSAELLYEAESSYNYIQVARWGEANVLFLNEGQGIHSMYFPDVPDHIDTRGTWDYFIAAPFFNENYEVSDVESLAVIGLAAGTTPKQYTDIFGPIPIDGMEIDPAIVEAGVEYFDMTEPNLNIILQDGRLALNLVDHEYDVVSIDAYKLPYIPWHLSTVEFFEEINAHLTDTGVVAINVGRTVNDRSLIETFSATMSEVYESVHVMDVPGSCNSILVATVQPTDPDNLIENLERLPEDVHPFLPVVLQRAHDAISETPEGGLVLTDDRAPTEIMTDMILVNFVLSGDTALPCQ